MDYKIIHDWKISDDGKRRRRIEFDLTTCKPLLDELYADLNNFCSEYNIPEKTNKEISWQLASYFMGKNIPDISKVPVQRKFQ